jgi:hypothetical protein
LAGCRKSQSASLLQVWHRNSTSADDHHAIFV